MTALSKGRKARNPWVQVAPGVRSRKILESPAATSRRIERNIQRDTLGLGHWRQPENWCTEPFSHTVTMVADVMGMMDGWQIYNSGVLVTLAVHPIEGPFVRGAPYVWCKAAQRRLSYGADLRPVHRMDQARPGSSRGPWQVRSAGRRICLLLPGCRHGWPRRRSLPPARKSPFPSRARGNASSSRQNSTCCSIT